MRIPVAGGLASFAELREGPRKVPGPCRSPEVLLSPSLLVFPWRRRITSFCIMDLRGQSDSETGSRSPRQVSRAGAPGCASHALSSTPVQLSSPSRAVSVCVCVSEGGMCASGCVCVCVCARACVGKLGSPYQEAASSFHAISLPRPFFPLLEAVRFLQVWTLIEIPAVTFECCPRPFPRKGKRTYTNTSARYSVSTSPSSQLLRRQAGGSGSFPEVTRWQRHG